jgi:hypothetical protein
MNPLYTDAEEAKEDESLVYSAARYLLAFPHRESHPSPDVTEVSVEMPPFRKYPPGTSDGLPCFRSWLGDLWVYSWVERTKPPTVNYQFTHREKEEHAH